MAAGRSKRAAGGGLLIHFLSDLLRKPRLQASLVRESAPVLERYGLSPAKIAALRSRDRAKLASALTAELWVEAAEVVPFWPPGPTKPKPTPKPRKPKPKPAPKPRKPKPRKKS